jgi:copper transport protein
MRDITILAALLAALLGTGEALAHASLIQSDPTDRAVVAQPPQKLTLTFNEPVSPLVLRLLLPNGETIDLDNVTTAGAIVTVTPPAGPLRGTYLLSWRVISADSHPVGGALTFSIGEPSAPPALPQESDIRLRGAIWLAKLLLYAGLFVGAGGVFYSRWIAIEPSAAWIGTTVRVALSCGLLAALVSLGFQGLDVLSLPLSRIREAQAWQSGLATAYGLTACIAAVSLLLGLVAHAAKGPLARWCAALSLAGVGAALAASGHAATARPQWATRPAVFLHGLSVAFWIGALAPLAASLAGRNGRAALARFSRAIPAPVVVLVASGFLLAIVQLQRLDALWTTSYGWLLFAKLVAVSVLLALAATNRWLTPRVIGGDRTAARWLVRSLRAELALVALILGIVACWRFTPPPRSLFAAAAQPVHVHIHAAKAMADLQIEPESEAGRQITVSVLDGEFRPLAAKEVELVLSRPAAGIEPLRWAATRLDTTTWRIERVRLPATGRWHARIEILVNDFEKVAVEDDIDLR